MVRLAHGLKEHDGSQIESELKPKRAVKLSFTSGGGGQRRDNDLYYRYIHI